MKFGNRLWGPDIGNLYSAGSAGIFKYNNGTWSTEIPEISFSAIYGNNINNIFTGTVFGDIYHYNGSGWKKDEILSSKLNSTVIDIWCNNDYVFITCSVGNQNYIARRIRK